MNDFEELAHRSADAIRQDVDDVPVPDFREPSRSGVLLLGVAVFLVAGLSVALWMRADADSVVETNDVPGEGEVDGDIGLPVDEVDGPTPIDPTGFRLVWPAEDYMIESIGTFPELPDDGDSATAHTTLYGRGPSAVPYAVDDLLVATWIDTDDFKDEFSGEEIVVRGGVGYRDQTLLELGFQDAVAFYEGDVAVVMASRTMAFEEIIEVANVVTFDGHIAISPLSSLSPLARIDALPFARRWGESDTWQVSYVNDSATSSVAVIGSPADPDRLMMERYIGRADESIELRGTSAWLLQSGPGEAPGTSSVAWMEQGNLVVLFSNGVDALVVAEELVAVDSERWDAAVLEVEARDTVAPPAAEMVVAWGEAVIDGAAVSWTVLVDPGRTFCLSTEWMTLPRGQTSCSNHDAPATPPMPILNLIGSVGPDVVEIGGTATSEVSRIVLEFGSGGVEDVTLIRDTVIGPVFGSVFEWTGGLVTVVAYDDDGKEIFRRDFV